MYGSFFLSIFLTGLADALTARFHQITGPGRSTIDCSFRTCLFFALTRDSCSGRHFARRPRTPPNRTPSYAIAFHRAMSARKIPVSNRGVQGPGHGVSLEILCFGLSGGPGE